jgi:hypothetical protein
MKVWLNRFLAIGLAAAFILTVASQANAARYEGLHGNDLFKDVNDINTFPQAASNYKNLVRIDMLDESAWFVVGDDSATYGVKAAGSDADHPTVLDMIYSMPMGADSLGIGLSLGMGGTGPAKDSDAADTSDMAIGLIIGYSMGAMNLDTALSVQMDSTSDGADKATTTSDMTIGVNARGYSSLGEGTDLGYLVSFEMANTGGDTAGEEGETTSAMDVTLGAGPVYKMDKGQVAAYGTLNYKGKTTSPAGDGDDVATSELGFPGFLVSAEVWLSDSLVWRGGASYGYSMDTKADESTSKSGSSGWSTGLGYKWDKFQIDGALDSGFYNRGPNFISGAEGDLFTHVSASYSF